MRWLRRRYGSSAGHLVAVLVGGVIAAYAVTRVPDLGTLASIALWFGFLIIAHDLLLFPVYAAVDNAAARLRRRSGSPRVPWTNYVRVPAVLSGILLIAWFPLILRLPAGFTRAAGRSADPFLWHWLGITAVLGGCSGVLYLAKLLSRTTSPRRGSRSH